jgi:putative Ca2+/H+ antiporter (TMEM165/GDT1 family)
VDQPILLAFFTTAGTLFVAELTDKDALFLLALATKTRASTVFAAGSVAFTITSAIIVTLGAILIRLVPIFAIKLAGGAIMLVYALFEYVRFSREAGEIEEREEKLLKGRRAGAWSIFLPAVLSLVLLDLAGDATELLTIVLVARFQLELVVFAGAVVGLVAATAVETMLGRWLGGVLSPNRIRYLSMAVFTVIGSIVVVSTLLGA